MKHDLQRGDLGIGAQHVEPIKARVLGDPRLNGKVLGRDNSDNGGSRCCRRAPCRLGRARAQPAEDGLALLGVAAGLGEIPTDDVPSLAELDLLGFETACSPEARGTTSGTNGV